MSDAAITHSSRRHSTHISRISALVMIRRASLAALPAPP